MRSLRVIQVLAKIMRVVCIVLFVCCIVGASACLTALIVLPIIQNIVVQDGKTIADLMVENGVVIPDMYAGIVVGLLGAGVGIFLNKYNELFFEEEIRVGTPFDHDIVRSMRKTGLVNIIASGALVITAGIAVGIVSAIFQTKIKFEYSLFAAVGFGLLLLILSLFADYGAELEDKLKSTSEE